MHAKQSLPNVVSQRKNGILANQLPRFVPLAIWPMSMQLFY
jgi:hypothetical protein